MIPMTNNRTYYSLSQYPPAIIPNGLGHECGEDYLKITYRQFPTNFSVAASFLIFILLTCLLSSIEWQVGLSVGALVAIFLLYYWMVARFNQVTVTVTSEDINIRYGPIPTLANERVASTSLKQLYIKKSQNRWELWVQQKNVVDDKPLLKNIYYPRYALFIEQEVEYFLGIKDKRMPDETPVPAIKPITLKYYWEIFAKKHQLHFVVGRYLERTKIFGKLRGYDFLLTGYYMPHVDLRGRLQTIVDVVILSDFTITEPNWLLNKKSMVTFEQLHHILQTLEDTSGIISLGQKFPQVVYEREFLFTDYPEKELFNQHELDRLCQLIEAYPSIMAFGGKMIPHLAKITYQSKHPLRETVSHLLPTIVSTTLPLEEQQHQLLCKNCLTQCSFHKATYLEYKPWANTSARILKPGREFHITYYGCRVCHQSQEFYQADQVVAVLNNQVDKLVLQEKPILRINWIVHNTLFDFDAVEIIQATDQQVERFAVQIGNDLDSVRAGRYKKMSYMLSSNCQLSENTERILSQIFGKRVNAKKS